MSELFSLMRSVEPFFTGLQETLCRAFESEDGGERFGRDKWARPEGGGGVSRVLRDGEVFEQAGVNFSLIAGKALPPSASLRRPELAGCPFQAAGISVVVHPGNPYVPTSHMNVRFFEAMNSEGAAVWWFGGGFDLTPYYGFTEDARHWHRMACAACAPFGKELYAEFKHWCDDYFYIKHRSEMRGIGGLFFDDLNRWDFMRCFAFVQRMSTYYLKAYLPVVVARKQWPFGERERQFQLYRRGRYVEFNLIHDRGTLFGLQSGGRVESILMSLPPLARWQYAWQPEPESPEARLSAEFLRARDWL